MGAGKDAGSTTSILHSTAAGAVLDVETPATTGGSQIAVKAHSTLGVGVDAAGFDNGVVGFSSNGNGLLGQTDIGFGVIGVAGGPGSVGVVASAPDEFSKTALSVRGQTRFSRSGVATVRANTSTVTVTGVAIYDSTRALATAQQSTTVWVKAAVPNAVAGTLTLVLNAKAPAGGVTIAWWLLEA